MKSNDAEYANQISYLRIRSRQSRILDESDCIHSSDQYSMNTEHGRDMINYDLIELVSAGLIREGESKIDDGTYKNGSLVTQYTLTNLGEDYLNDLKSKVIRQV